MNREQILKGLNPIQKSAVTNPAKTLQVLAPPGSGKTKTLTARVAYLITNNGLRPRNIIVCTFTVKAAREMQDRICGLLGHELAGSLIIGTFHSVARRFLATYGELIGLSKKFGVADATDSTSMITRIIKNLKLDIQPAVAKSRISKLKARSVSSTEHSASSREVKEQEFSLVYVEYERLLHISNLLDYDDLLLKCAELLRRCPSCVCNVEAVLIDEFQDTNYVQFDLMQLFAQERNVITIVGDPDQSIYGWRSAEIENLRRMQARYPETVVISLKENYRSAGAILLAAQEIIEQDHARPPKQLMPTHSMGVRPVLRRLSTAAEEAAWTVSEIRRSIALTGNLLSYSDYAVLLRSASVSRSIESELTKASIPYKMVGGNRFYDRYEVKLTLDFLRVIDHADHNDAVVRVINVPPRGIGEVTMQNLLSEAAQRGRSLWYLIRHISQGNINSKTRILPEARKGLASFTNFVLTTRLKMTEISQGGGSLADLVAHVLSKANIAMAIKKNKGEEEFEARWANVEELVAQASDVTIEQFVDELSSAGSVMDLQETPLPCAKSIHDTLSQFLANIALSTEIEKSDEKGQSNQQVTLSTIHAAKGLEWPVVFIPSAYDGSIPHSRAEDNDEERRLLYVAMTRAQALLYISYPKMTSQGEQATLSSFLSQRLTSGYFDRNGFDFRHTDTKELAAILGRTCPTREDCQRASSRLGHGKADCWPVDDKTDDDPRKQWNATEDGNTLTRDDFSCKRRRLQADPCGDSSDRPVTSNWYAARTTMQKQQDYSEARATFSASFISAAALKPEDIQRETKMHSRNILWEKSHNAPQKPKKERDRTAKAGQGSLTEFFPAKVTAPIPKGCIVERDRPAQAPAQDCALLQTTSEDAVRTHATKPVAPKVHGTSANRIANNIVETKTLGVRRSLNGLNSGSFKCPTLSDRLMSRSGRQQ